MGKVALALLAALILGFLTKRIMIPSAVHYIAYRPPEVTQPVDSATSKPNSNSGARDGSEQLTPGDRSELDAIVKRKSK